jgi:fumarate reductase subunit C
MVDNKQKAEKLEFICKKQKIQPADSAILGVSLKVSTSLGILSFLSQELIFIPMLWDNFNRNPQFWFIYFFLISIARIVTCIRFGQALSKNNFTQSVKAYRILKSLTCLQVVNFIISLVSYMLQLRCGDFWFQQMFRIEDLLEAGLLVVLNVYTLYIFYSYTKHLGLGNFALINVANTAAVNTSSNYGEILVAPGTARSNLSVLNVGNPLTNTGVTNINDANACQAGSSYPSFEDKIVLNHPGDIAFCQTAQNAIINGIVLPSGLKVPSGKDGKNWRVIGNEITLI